MSVLHNAFSLFPYLYFTHIGPDTPLLIMTDHPQRAAIRFEDMQIPATVFLPEQYTSQLPPAGNGVTLLHQSAHLLAQPHRFGVIVIDFEREDPRDFSALPDNSLPRMDSWFFWTGPCPAPRLCGG